MAGFFKLLTICFGIVSLSSICLAFIFSWLALSPKASQEHSDRCSDSMFRCTFAAYYTFIMTVGCGVLWCIFDVMTLKGWWPIA